MKHSFIFSCNNCQHEIEVPSHWGEQYDAGKCSECGSGSLVRCGESYDQEWVEEQRYNERQDREYEERHRYDGRY